MKPQFPQNKLKSKIIREIAEENGGDYSELRRIVETQFEFVAKAIKHSGFQTVKLPYFGKFTVNPKRVEHLTNKFNENLLYAQLVQRGEVQSDSGSGDKDNPRVRLTDKEG